MKTKLTTNNIQQWLTANAASLKDIETRINETGMCVPITCSLKEIAAAVDDEQLDMATSGLRIALKDGMYYAGQTLKSDINNLIKIIK